MLQRVVKFLLGDFGLRLVELSEEDFVVVGKEVEGDVMYWNSPVVGLFAVRVAVKSLKQETCGLKAGMMSMLKRRVGKQMEMVSLQSLGQLVSASWEVVGHLYQQRGQKR